MYIRKKDNFNLDFLKAKALVNFEFTRAFYCSP
jgi:hypothetical protein